MEEMNKINSIQNYIGTYSFEPESDEFILDHLAQKSAPEKRVKFGEIICVGSEHFAKKFQKRSCRQNFQ